jgi:hypothetical protein
VNECLLFSSNCVPRAWSKEREFVSIPSVGAKNERSRRVSEARDKEEPLYVFSKSGVKGDCS